jgi:uncharacterized membrane protein
MSTQVVTASSVLASKPASYRLESIDLLRGLLMLLMALDHTRDFFSVPTGDLGDPLTSWPALFATRWITHLCAPGFIALAGISVYLQRRRGKSAEQMARMLLTRGAWLILLEVTVVSFAWAFSPSTLVTKLTLKGKRATGVEITFDATGQRSVGNASDYLSKAPLGQRAPKTPKKV